MTRLERLEEISIRNFAKRKEEEDGYDDDDETDDTLRIGDPVSLGDLLFLTRVRVSIMKIYQTPPLLKTLNCLMEEVSF